MKQSFETTTTTQPNQTGKEAFAYAYFTVNQFQKKHRALTLGGLRALIFNEETNGLAKSGAIIRIGRKILIDEGKFFAWVESQNKKVAA
ncbi:hypothetical protein [Methylobacter psychrophilus]|uniref:hypothetical protein n=1 Tax=Methylobacter psychrophilus TaxID=96941 RepID=UPI0021D4B484|nr:hypothetical protein [Methylobacter psychrophilus]